MTSPIGKWCVFQSGTWQDFFFAAKITRETAKCWYYIRPHSEEGDIENRKAKSDDLIISTWDTAEQAMEQAESLQAVLRDLRARYKSERLETLERYRMDKEDDLGRGDDDPWVRP